MPRIISTRPTTTPRKWNASILKSLPWWRGCMRKPLRHLLRRRLKCMRLARTAVTPKFISRSPGLPRWSRRLTATTSSCSPRVFPVDFNKSLTYRLTYRHCLAPMPRPLHKPCVCVVSPPFQSAAGWITTLFDLDLIDALVRRVFKI